MRIRHAAPHHPRRMPLHPSPAAPAAPVLSPAAPSCANCGTAVPGKFCGECGQRNATRLISVRRMLWDVLDDQLTLNSALPRTLFGLLLRPGHLTREYAAGRIARYVPPVRLYLASSLLFFLALALIADPVQLGEKVDTEFGRGEALADTAAHASAAAAAKPRTKQGKFIQFGPWRDSTVAPLWARPLARRMARQEDRLNAMSKGQAVSAIAAGAEQNAPKAMFLLLPVFALILKILFVRRKRYYAEHFVFALHVHALAFLAFSIMLVTRNPGLSAALFLWVLIYVFLAMRRVYGQGFMRTGAKYMALGWAYFFALTFMIFVTMAITTLTL